MSAQSITRRLTQADLTKLYAASEKVVMFTCYDASFARLLDGAGVEVLLIGDSLGNVIQGHDTTLPVTVADIAYHTAAVKRGSDRPFIIADMPFGSYQESPEQAFRNAVTLMAAGAQMVKLEGGKEMAPTVTFLVSRGIPVCGHGTAGGVVERTGAGHEVAYELGFLARRNVEGVVHDQHLAGAVGAGADADGDDVQAGGDFGGQYGGDGFEDDHRRAGVLQGQRVIF